MSSETITNNSDRITNLQELPPFKTSGGAIKWTNDDACGNEVVAYLMVKSWVSWTRDVTYDLITEEGTTYACTTTPEEAYRILLDRIKEAGPDDWHLNS